MRTFKQGNPALIAKVNSEAFHRTFMDGDGCQAPGAIVIRKTKEDRGDGQPEYAVHFANTQCGGYHGGVYVTSPEEALEEFQKRVSQYDPDGSRRFSYNAGTGEPHSVEE